MSITEEQAAEALQSAPPIILSPGPRTIERTAPDPDEVWELPNGIARVYLGEGNDRLTRPVLIADGFSSGPSDIDYTWELLEHGPYPLLSRIRARGSDVVLIGYDERSASILENAETVTKAVEKAVEDRDGDHPLAVGGFSMGGLVSRYALTKMETEGREHQARLYFSYDSPHNGAWIPLSLQAFAHYIKRLNAGFSNQINSPAARQLLWRHIAHWEDEPAMSEGRLEFLRALEEVGDWPQEPQRIALANGPATGVGNGVTPGVEAIIGKGASITGTELFTQATGNDRLVARLRVVSAPTREVHTHGLPDIDSAPGGTLPGFGILATELNRLPALYGFKVDAPIPGHCFVPAVSAIAAREPATNDDLYTPISDEEMEKTPFHEVKLSSQSETHTLVTEELAGWLLERLP
ncbi:esterase/lipase family protein [Nocardiopsis alba]|uniref:esterase/lipase family protein n=1 Tax=Nocardiopsis alba TaxID=53437 RepID=UPI0033C23198